MRRIVPSAARSVARYHRGMATLSRSDVEHVAHLARLGLTDEELGRLEGQLNHILDQYAILAEVPTDHIAPTAQTIELENILRDDVVVPSLPVADVVAQRRRARGRPDRRARDPGRRLTPMPTDPTGLLAHELAAELRAGGLSSRDATAAHLDAAERDNGALNAWLTIDRDRALAEADAADARLAAARRDGASALEALHPLLGVPVGLKDLVSVKGGQCTAGSRILEGYIAPYDAHITERLRDAGAVILGKTNMDEFAMGSSTEHSAYGPVANPWALDRVPGGSSGGSAAAVAARHVPLSIGTDTGGSIRQPAALCGIVGLKPTYGRVSRYGIVAFASSLDQIGPFARDSRDAAALLHAVAGRDPRDSTSSPEPVPDDAAPPAGVGRRGGLEPPRQAVRPAARVLRRGDGAGGRGPRARRGGRARGCGSERRGRQPAAHRVRARDVLHRRAGRGVGQPRPLRRHPLRPAARRRDGRARRTTSRRAARASAPRSSAGSCSGRTRSRPATTTRTT